VYILQNACQSSSDDPRTTAQLVLRAETTVDVSMLGETAILCTTIGRM
jgi:hypothetical protein